MDWTLEVVIVPVSDLGAAIAFYRDQVGFDLDHETQNEHMHIAQLTPRGSVFGGIAASFGVGEAAAAQAHAYSVLAGMAAAVVRLGCVAPFEAQAALRQALVEPGPPAASGDEADDDWGLFSPLLDIAAMRHELAEPRLFAS